MIKKLLIIRVLSTFEEAERQTFFRRKTIVVRRRLSLALVDSASHSFYFRLLFGELSLELVGASTLSYQQPAIPSFAKSRGPISKSLSFLAPFPSALSVDC